MLLDILYYYVMFLGGVQGERGAEPGPAGGGATCDSGAQLLSGRRERSTCVLSTHNTPESRLY